MFLPFKRGPEKPPYSLYHLLPGSYLFIVVVSFFFFFSSALFSSETAENVCFLLVEVETFAV